MRDYLDVGNVEATDPRASGRLTSVTNMNMLDVAGGGVGTGATSMRLVDDGGAWSGTSQGLLMYAEGGGATTMAKLIGEGGYKGLTLVMVQYADDDTVTNRGVIVPSDQMPPLPDPVEQPA